MSLPTRVGTVFEVTGESSLEAARRLGGAVAVLNFASARNPGGGYLNGAQAQEEALCRASALYTCLLRAPVYDHHRAHRDPFYTDRVVHSPGVPVFRDDRGRLLDEPFTAGFLTSAAPNAGVVLRTAPERAADLPAALAARAERVLETAVAHGYRRLVLGAWGCGVFPATTPPQVAGAFRTLLGPGGRFAGAFDRVAFGILDRARAPPSGRRSSGPPRRARAADSHRHPHRPGRRDARRRGPLRHRPPLPALRATRTRTGSVPGSAPGSRWSAGTAGEP
ncbi:TIGR02452 family protein OS=Streptomyces tendae OX=1932 GN=GUR47_03945 PE=4 SV=1 [Streptomyces tendae]